MGLRYESMADMPAGMRQKYEKKMAVRFFSPKGDGDPYEKKKRQNKYHAEQAAVPLKNGKTLVFDSRKEMRRFLELQELQKAGEIRNLRLQVDFTLQEGFTTPDGERVRAIRYRADFTYDERDHDREEVAADCGFPCEAWNNGIIEDVKGKKTKEYLMKRKMMQEVYGIKIREV